MVWSVSPGTDWRYYARSVGNGEGRPNYYSAAVHAGEPPGIWRGTAAEAIGLTGKANDHQLEALFGHFVDPRDPRFYDKASWDEADKLGRKPSQFKTTDQIFAELIAKEPNPEAVEDERKTELMKAAIGKTQVARPFFDMTYSPAKSTTVLYTAFMSEAAAAIERGDTAEAAMWQSRAKLVEDAVMEASAAGLAHLERKAGYTRVGYHGGKLKSGESTGRWEKGKGFVVASFFQHTSRPISGNESPQLHVHNLILNRIERQNGQWRTLDGKLLYQEKAAAGAVSDRVLQARLTDTLGVGWQYDPRSKTFEITGIDRNVRDVFSPRRQAINGLVREYVEQFEQRVGRLPNALELSKISQTATLNSRGKKLSQENAKTLDQNIQEWTDRAKEHATSTLHEIAHGAINRDSETLEAEVFDPRIVVSNAIASVEESRAVWTRSDLLQHLHRCLPAHLHSLETGYQERVLNELADRALQPDPWRIGADDEVVCLTAPEFFETPREFQLPTGETSFRRYGSEQYATRRLLDAESRIAQAARADFGAVRVEHEVAEAAITDINKELRANDPDREARLSADQEHILRGILTSGARTEVIVGPAGAGKSFVMGRLSDEWERRTGGRAIGLATAQAGADVLADEGLAQTANIAKWLGLQDAIDDNEVSASVRATWRVRAGDLVIVDEASMVDSMSLAAIQQRVDEAGAKLVMVGDHRQLDAVGPGGSFTLAQQAADHIYELSEVRRFKAGWERDASLRLREGDTAAVTEYDAHGRLIDCDNLDQAYDRAAALYVGDTLAGRKSYLVAGTNEEAAEIAMRVRDQLVRHGLVEEHGVAIGQGNTTGIAGVGDLVQARKNNRQITNDEGQSLVNRNRYTVVETGDDGSLTVQAIGSDGTLGQPITVPASYVQSHMSLAYAVTQHGVQGGTSYAGYGIITPSTSASAAYVALTRGTDLNVAFVVDNPSVLDLDQTASVPEENEPRRSGAQILAEVIERDSTERSATQTLRENYADAGSMKVINHRIYESRRHLAATKWSAILADLLPAEAADGFDEDPASGTLYRLLDTLEAEGHDPQALLADAIAVRELDSAESVAQVLHWRINGQLDAANVERELADLDAELAAEVAEREAAEREAALAAAAPDIDWSDLAEDSETDLAEPDNDREDPSGAALETAEVPVAEVPDIDWSDLAEAAAEPVEAAAKGEPAAEDAEPVEPSYLPPRYRERIPDGNTPVHEYARGWAELADRRVDQLGEILAANPPQWATDAIGPVPADPIDREAWIRRAGTVEAYRETYGITDEPAVIGRAPSRNAPERAEEWAAAHQALGSPETLTPEQQLSEAELRLAVERYEAEKAWAPPAVRAELKATSQQAITTRAEVTLLEVERARLEEELGQIAEAEARLAELENRIAEADEQATQLEEHRDRLERVHEVRSTWHLHTIEQRAAAKAAQEELARREAEAAEQARIQPQVQAETAEPTLTYGQQWALDQLRDRRIAAENARDAQIRTAQRLFGADEAPADFYEMHDEAPPAELRARIEHWTKREDEMRAQFKREAQEARTPLAETQPEAVADQAPEVAPVERDQAQAEQAETTAGLTAKDEPAVTAAPEIEDTTPTAENERPEAEAAVEEVTADEAPAEERDPVRDAFPDRDAFVPVDISEASAKAEAAAARLAEQAEADAAREAEAQRERDAQAERDEAAAEAAREAAEYYRDEGLSL